MRFDSAALIEEILWDMRVSEEPRAADRALLQKTYNGAPPFPQDEAEENNIQINRSSLEGPNIISSARRQWNNAYLKPTNYFTAKPDFTDKNLLFARPQVLSAARVSAARVSQKRR